MPLTDYENLISTFRAMEFEEWYGPDEDMPAKTYVCYTYPIGIQEVIISSMGPGYEGPVNLFRFTFKSNGQLLGYCPVTPDGD